MFDTDDIAEAKRMLPIYKQAVDVLEKVSGKNAEQAEQEPVAWMWRCKPYCDWPNWNVSIKRPVDSGCGDFPKTEGYEDIPLYAAPVRTKDLTDDEIYTLYSEPCSDREMIEFARAVIAADREKNR